MAKLKLAHSFCNQTQKNRKIVVEILGSSWGLALTLKAES
jgi:hypothetical protein